MLVLVANLGSTSFKYRLFEMTDDGALDDIQNARSLAQGAVDRIGEPESRCTVTIGDWSDDLTMSVPDHGVAVQACLDQLTDEQHGAIKDASEVAAIGFKAVHGGRLSGVFVVDDNVLDAMAEMNAAAPAHNPPYIAAMKTLRERFPNLPLVAAFETDFHQTIPAARKEYAIPRQWANEFHIRKWGFHGASHRFIAFRSAEILGRKDARVISCHLGGSSSITAIESRQSVQTTMGMTPQTGLPQNNRVGDFDPFALPLICQRTGLSLEDALKELASKGGLLGLSNHSGDIRDIEQAAASGDENCQLALDVFIQEIRRHVGGMLVALGGADAIVFTGGIGENDVAIREGVCQGLADLGIEFDDQANASVRDRANAAGEASFHGPGSKTQLWVIPTNEEVIVARQTVHAIQAS